MVQIQEIIKNMTPEQFVYWLQGFMEIANPTTLDEKQVQEIKNHLEAVFHKVTPNTNQKLYSDFPFPETHGHPFTGGREGNVYCSPEVKDWIKEIPANKEFTFIC